MYKIIGDRLIKEEIIETSTQTAIIKSDVEVVDNPNNETLELADLPTRPQETDTHFVRLKLLNGTLEYLLLERPKPIEEQIVQLDKRQVETENTVLLLMDLQMGGM